MFLCKEWLDSLDEVIVLQCMDVVWYSIGLIAYVYVVFELGMFDVSV